MKPGDMHGHVPQVLPHYRLRDRQLFFMISRRPSIELSSDDVLLYSGIDGRKTVAELEQTHSGAGHRLLTWREAGIIALIPPVTPPTGPHLLVIEPHMDDAALSAGGRLILRRGQCRITILSVVRWSNFTSYLLLKRNFFDVSAITDLRLQESILAARLLGAKHCCLDWADAPLRFWRERWSPETVERFSVAPEVFVCRFPSPKEVSLLSERLMHEVSFLAPDELWIPMGLGDHVDHRATRSASLMMLAEDRRRFSGMPVVMYEDLPHTGGDHAARISAAFAARGTRLVRGTEDITDIFEEKLRVLSVYASQFKLSVIGPRIRRCAECEGHAGSPSPKFRGELRSSAGALAEAYHRVEGEPRLPLESHLSLHWPGMTTFRTKAHALIGKREKCRRLAVLALPSGRLGRWKDERESLLAAFPNADVRLYVDESVAWQTQESGPSMLRRLKVVRKRWWGWARVAAREFFQFGTPTVILWHASYQANASLKKRLLQSFLPLRYVLFAQALSDFCALLSEQIGNLTM